MRKFILMMLPISLILFLSGCSIFVKEVDYQTIANDLNEKNSDKILNAVDGYAEIKNWAYLITSTPGDSNRISKETDELYFKGVYNTVEDRALGNATSTHLSSVEVDNEVEQQSENKSPSFSVIYADNKYINNETKEELDVLLLIDKLQGIEKVVPKDYSYGLDVPPSIFYDLNEVEFNEIINDDLKIEYDIFKRATILVTMQEGEARKPYATDIDISIGWEKRENSSELIDYHLFSGVSFNSGNLNPIEKYNQLKTDK